LLPVGHSRKPAGVRAKSGALEIAEGERSHPAWLSFMLSRCDDAAFFTSLGPAELVVLFHCNSDFAMVESFNPRSR
jgi:hypothetical protein